MGQAKSRSDKGSVAGGLVSSLKVQINMFEGPAETEVGFLVVELPLMFMVHLLFIYYFKENKVK